MKKIILISVFSSLGLMGCETTQATKTDMEDAPAVEKIVAPAPAPTSASAPATTNVECEEGDDLCDTGGTRGVNE